MTKLMTAGLLAGLVAASAAVADEKAMKALEGTYTVTAAEKGGQPAPKEFLDAMTVTFKGDEFVLKAGPGTKKAKFKVDTTKTPFTIDLMPTETDGDAKGKTFPGLYKLDKGELTLVMVEKGDRPKDFTSAGEAMLLKLKKADK